ncbi:hypothetical protein DFH11DRAFT_79687 [Phellopilus nigrolimitatus]|nr:hypothetical protein DFH11DRAFT_79687 [Phellopilus nigrolimitatus]
MQRVAPSPGPGWEALHEPESSSADEVEDELAPSLSRSSGNSVNSNPNTPRPSASTHKSSQSASTSRWLQGAEAEAVRSASTKAAQDGKQPYPGMQSVWRAANLSPPTQIRMETRPTVINLTRPGPDLSAAPFSQSSVARKSSGNQRPKFSTAKSSSASVVSNKTSTSAQPHAQNTAASSAPGPSRSESTSILHRDKGKARESSSSESDAPFRLSQKTVWKSAEKPKSRQRKEELESDGSDFPATISRSFRKPVSKDKSSFKENTRTSAISSSSQSVRKDVKKITTEKVKAASGGTSDFPNTDAAPSSRPTRQFKDREEVRKNATEKLKSTGSHNSSAGLPFTQPKQAASSGSGRIPPSTQPTSTNLPAKPIVSMSATQPNPKSKGSLLNTY